MAIELKMPALSPTMEEGSLAKWLVKEGDTVQSGDLLAEIETDKATMEFEAVDEGVIAKILVAEGTGGVKVGTVIAMIAGEDEDADAVKAPAAKAQQAPAKESASAAAAAPAAAASAPAATAAPVSADGERIKISPLARRLAAEQGIDVSKLTGTGPGGRIVKADLAGAASAAVAAPQAAATPATSAAPAAAATPFQTDIPHSAEKLSNMRKTIARRLTEAKQRDRKSVV